MISVPADEDPPGGLAEPARSAHSVAARTMSASVSVPHASGRAAGTSPPAPARSQHCRGQDARREHRTSARHLRFKRPAPLAPARSSCRTAARAARTSRSRC
jgi:hypothetical protein